MRQPSEPLYVHDCDKCVFLGRIDDGADAYYCSQGGVLSTIVLRDSDDPPDYRSAWVLIESLPAPIAAEARRLAAEAGV